MERRKSPRSYGLLVEFYLLIWEIIGSDLVDVLNNSYEVSTLPTSMRQAMITLAYKKGDKNFLANWQPISLLNIDYKIGSKSLANWLQPGLEYVFHPDQTCNILGCSITENPPPDKGSFRIYLSKTLLSSYDQFWPGESFWLVRLVLPGQGHGKDEFWQKSL